MEVVLLGTGAADGWPNPFCDCASCTWMRVHDDIRGQAAALVDDVLLLDCGPEVPRAAERLGHPLTGVRHLLLTHGHPDHADPAALMWRDWAGAGEPIDVVAPPAVIREWRRWVADTAPVRWREARAGDRIDVGGYTVRVLPAEHAGPAVGPAVLYDVTGPDGNRLLYACDTRSLPAAPDGARYDLVILEETNGLADEMSSGIGHDHLNLRTFGLAVAGLRRCGAVSDETRVVASHLGHRNPPPPALAARLAAYGAEVLPDGAVVSLPGSVPGRRRPPRRVLVLGGARSGKSAYAESLLMAEPEVTYAATSLPRPDDAEWGARVAAHRARRPAAWTTVETVDVAGVLCEATGPVLVDCLALWLGAHLDDPDLDAHLDALVEAWRHGRTTLVAVSNEVGSGVVPATEAGRRFRDELGRLNARLAGESDEVWLLEAGIPRRLGRGDA